MNDYGTVHLKDEKFNPAQSREMQLLIKVGSDRMSYAIVNERDNRLMVLYDSALTQSVEDAIGDLLSENDYIRSSFSKIKVAVQTLNFTFIPQQYYTRDDLPGYEKIIQAQEETKTFVSDVNDHSVKSVVALELKTIAPLISAFSEVKLMSQAEPVIEGNLKTRELKSKRLFLQFNSDSFEACLCNEDKFIFYNVFSTGNADDFNYYLLMLMEQLSIDGAGTSAILAGNISANDELHNRVAKYFQHVRFADCSELTALSPVFDDLPKHRHFSLISLLLCG